MQEKAWRGEPGESRGELVGVPLVHISVGFQSKTPLQWQQRELVEFAKVYFFSIPFLCVCKLGKCSFTQLGSTETCFLTSSIHQVVYRN